MYRFLVKPRWLAFHLLVIGLVVLMVNLAFWQLRRLDDKRNFNAEVRSREAAPAVPLTSLATSDDPLTIGKSLQWRTVTATGTYDVGQQVLIRNRSLDGVPGDHVVTPLVLADGTALLVNRGWIPLSGGGDRPAEAPDPPQGSVTVTGRVRATQERVRLGPRDPADGRLTVLSRVDVARIERQAPYPLLPLYVELTAQQPPNVGELPRTIPEPALDEGPHLSYAGQWFLFSICAIVGWVLVVRKTAKSRRQEAALLARAQARPAEPLRGVRVVPRGEPAETETEAADNGPPDPH